MRITDHKTGRTFFSKLRRRYDDQGPRQLTFSCFRQFRFLERDRTRRWFVEALEEARLERPVELWAYVIMPEHVHLVIVPSSGAGLSKMIQHVKGRFSWLYSRKNGAHGKLWQSRYYETVVRDEASLLRRIQYVEGDPVRAGIVSRPEEYPFSSAAGGRDDLDRYLSPGAAAEVWPG